MKFDEKIVIYGAMVAYLIYMYVQGSRGVEYRSFYNFIRDPSWKKFRIWYADMANDVWGTIVFTLVYSVLPLPFFQPGLDPIDRFLASLGLTYLTNAIILGRPTYNVNQIWSVADYIIAYTVAALVITSVGQRFLNSAA